MTIQPIGDQSVALYITHTDLRAHGLTPQSLTAQRALDMTRDAFRQSGLVLEGALEIEAYPDERGVLVFAHVRPPERLWLSFPDFEVLLSAQRALSAPPEGAALYWWEGRYWLSLPGAAQAAQAVLSEYGRTEEAGPQQEARLAEHGLPIAGEELFSTLSRYFPA